MTALGIFFAAEGIEQFPFYNLCVRVLRELIHQLASAYRKPPVRNAHIAALGVRLRGEGLCSLALFHDKALVLN